MKKISTTNILTNIDKKKVPVKKLKNLVKSKVKITNRPKTKASLLKKNKTQKKSKSKKVSKITSLKSKKVIKNTGSEKTDSKVNNLRISKSNEVKPEIKKVKKQETKLKMTLFIQNMVLVKLQNLKK